jgi:hypothetical protein
MRTLLALALSLAFAVPAPQQEEEPLGRVPPPITKRTAADFEKLIQKMQGAWQLIELRAPAGNSVSRMEVGYLLVSQDFMSVEFHMGFFDQQPGQMSESFFQSGTYRLRPDARGYFLTQTLIGSFFDEEERLIFEPPGVRRRYAAEVVGDRLVLIRIADATRFTFERLRSGKDFDFYGRALPEEETEGEAEEAEEAGAKPGRRGGG